MQSDEFEFTFSNFLDRREYDEAESALFSIVRAAFLAGWEAAGGKHPEPQPIFRLIEKTDSDNH